MAMLSFDIRKLETKAQAVDGLLELDDPVWQDGDVLPEQPGVQAHGRLSAAGTGRFYLSGRLSGKATTSCRRCLAEVSAPVSGELHLFFSQSDEDDEEEADVVPIPAGEWEIDLRPVIREEWLLAVPPFALCREDCLGLCPTCGVDRNREACSCLPSHDPRWDGLRTLRHSDS